MKKFYLSTIFFFAIFIAQAQIVNIPDPAFKSFLIATMYVDTNLDLEIQVSEAQSCFFLNINGSAITDLTGIEAFTGLSTISITDTSITNLNLMASTNLTVLTCTGNDNLTSLNVSNLNLLTHLLCSENQLNTLDLSTLTNLEFLECYANNLSNLEVNNLTNLTYLKCSENHLTSLDVSNLVNLEQLLVYYNDLTSIDVSHCPNLFSLHLDRNPVHTLDVSALVNLKYLGCSETQLTTLDVTHNPALLNLFCSKNQLTEINLDHQGQLVKGDFSYNLFTTLDFSHTRLIGPNDYLFFSENPQLAYVNLKNGRPFGGSLSGSLCPNLRFICADDDNIVFVQNTLQDNPNIQVNSYCSFTPGGIYNTIAGTQTFDVNNNGCDISDPHVPLMKVTINDGTENGATFSNANGNFSFNTQTGSFVLTPVVENPYFMISPTSATISFSALDGSTQTQNFCVTPNGIHNDLEISILPIQRARPGFDATYQVVYKNKGNQTLSGNVNFDFDDAVLDFVSSNPALSNQTLNNLNWNYANLLPFESRTIYFTLNVNSPMETPAVNIGDILNFTASIDPIAGDETIADNTFPLVQTVAGSFDPNDKTCLEGNTITPEIVGNYLHYLIRFQNKGTFLAENVVVNDVIDTTKFDMASLQLTSTSHPQVTKITDNQVEFQFENINLPAEIDDAAGSHGYVAFKIKTKSNLVIGDSIENKADIFFDYNFPIETNTATSTVALLGVNAFENTSVSIAPNPTKNTIHITSIGNVTSVQLFDLQGRILETMTANEETVDFDLSQKNSGVYFVKIYTVKGVKVEKVIKE